MRLWKSNTDSGSTSNDALTENQSVSRRSFGSSSTAATTSFSSDPSLFNTAQKHKQHHQSYTTNIHEQPFIIKNLDEVYGTPQTLFVSSSQHSEPSSHSNDNNKIVTTDAASSLRHSQLSMGGLLRLFRSEFFDAYMAVTYLYRYRDSPGVQDYLCNELCTLRDSDLEDYLPQICSLLLHHVQHPQALEKFLFDRCSVSMHIAFQVYWFLQSATDDAIAAKDQLNEHVRRNLRNSCETASVNGVADDIVHLTSTPALHQDEQQRINSEPVLNESLSEERRESHEIASVEEEEEAVEKNQSEKSGHTDSVSVQAAEAIDSDERVDTDVGTPAEIGSENGEIDEDYVERQCAVESNVDQECDRTESEPQVEGDTHEIETKEHGSAESDSVISVRESLLALKQERFDYFSDMLLVVKSLVKLSLSIHDVVASERLNALKRGLNQVNSLLLKRMQGSSAASMTPFDSSLESEMSVQQVAELGEKAAKRSIHLPLSRASSPALRLLRINIDETILLSTRTKDPYMLFLEVYESKLLCSDPYIFCEELRDQIYTKESELESNEIKRNDVKTEETQTHRVLKGDSVTENENESVIEDDEDEVTSKSRKSYFSSGSSSKKKPKSRSAQRRLADPAKLVRESVRRQVYGRNVQNLFGRVDLLPVDEDADVIEAKKLTMLVLVYGELWQYKEKRILNSSPFGTIPNTKLAAFIVKAGDDLRQEQLAMQLIRQFQWIFQTENVDVTLRPFNIICVNADAGLVELVPNAVSLHALKKRVPNFTSLRNYFERTYGAPETTSFKLALRNFVMSMAGYSLVSYFLQIKDRHNGNLMIDADGNLVHIDFGFMLTNSPGAIKFESAPFKLTDELMDVMGGEKSDAYKYFKELIVFGFLAARKHSEKIFALVEILLESNSVMPCMQGGKILLEQLQARFFPSLPEHECIRQVLALIDESARNWRSQQYDRFQWYTNGIL
uniref:1-phosphatidylinositol 4-kinase n=1 Tax=Timspurckia oligopyrenoides TaxID=708627 RepID=A0A7S0ZJ17_9RHOD